MLQVTGRVAGKSGYYFIRQQKALGDVNGYIEEMINGQKVIKVFCHEEKAKEIFDQKNEELCKDASAANSFANILMPIMGNLETCSMCCWQQSEAQWLLAAWAV